MQMPYHYSFSVKVFESIHDAGSTKISLPYYKIGSVLLTFPLKGLADALQAAGFDTRGYTQYESTLHLDGGFVNKTLFWLHESEYEEFLQLRSGSKFKTTYDVRQRR